MAVEKSGERMRKRKVTVKKKRWGYLTKEKAQIGSASGKGGTGNQQRKGMRVGECSVAWEVGAYVTQIKAITKTQEVKTF